MARKSVLDPEPEDKLPPPEFEGAKIEDAIRRRAAAKAIAAEQEKIADEAGDEIQAFMLVHDVTKMKVLNFVAAVYPKKKESYSPEKLLEAGVTIDQLNRGLVSTPYNELRVTRIKGT